MENMIKYGASKLRDSRFLMMNIIKRVFGDGSRTARVIGNIQGIFLIKALSLSCKLLMVPMVLNYLEPLKFGLWMALNSIVQMLVFFDGGVGSSLRNRLATSLAENKPKDGKTYVSTAYALLIIILVPLSILLVLVFQFLDWSNLLNAPQELGEEMHALLTWMVILYFSKIVFSLIFQVLKAIQYPVFGSLLDLVTDLLSLAVIFFLASYVSNSSLFIFGVSIFTVMALVPFVGSLIIYQHYLGHISPSSGLIRFDFARNLLDAGGKFFVIQICSIVIFTTDYLIITRLFGPEKVAPYAIVFQYFNLVTIFFATVSVPLWSAYTDAYTKQDFGWIKTTINRMLLLWVATIGVVLVMVVLAEPVIAIWLSRNLPFDDLLIVLMGLYVILQAWNRVFGWLLSGIGDLNHTVFSMVVGALINIPISIYFARDLGMQSSGVILGTIVSLSIFGFLAPYRVRHLFAKIDN